MVNVLGLSGLRNAYRSVLSAVGSSEISGASRWLEAVLEPGARRPADRASSVAPAAARRTNATFRISGCSFLRRPVGWLVVAVVRRLFGGGPGPVRSGR